MTFIGPIPKCSIPECKYAGSYELGTDRCVTCSELEYSGREQCVRCGSYKLVSPEFCAEGCAVLCEDCHDLTPCGVKSKELGPWQRKCSSCPCLYDFRYTPSSWRGLCLPCQTSGDPELYHRRRRPRFVRCGGSGCSEAVDLDSRLVASSAGYCVVCYYVAINHSVDLWVARNAVKGNTPNEWTYESDLDDVTQAEDDVSQAEQVIVRPPPIRVPDESVWNQVDSDSDYDYEPDWDTDVPLPEERVLTLEQVLDLTWSIVRY